MPLLFTIFSIEGNIEVIDKEYNMIANPSFKFSFESYEDLLIYVYFHCIVRIIILNNSNSVNYWCLLK